MMPLITSFKALSRLWQGVITIVLLLAAIWAFTFIRGLFVGSADTEAEIATNQADAAIQSGQDAANTVGENQDAANATDDKVEGITNDVQNADGSSAADNAARDGLCVNFGICDEK